MALRYRRELELSIQDALPARRLAAHLSIEIIAPEQVPGLTPAHLECLKAPNSDWWSAGILSYDGATVIILNTTHAPSRQESNIMHEIGHKLCGHKPTGIVTQRGVPFPLRTYEKSHEGEAECLGYCLQVPRDGLTWAIQQGMDTGAIAEHFGASKSVIDYRRGITGVDKQFSRRPYNHSIGQRSGTTLSRS